MVNGQLQRAARLAWGYGVATVLLRRCPRVVLLCSSSAHLALAGPGARVSLAALAALGGTIAADTNIMTSLSQPLTCCTAWIKTLAPSKGRWYFLVSLFSVERAE